MMKQPVSILLLIAIMLCSGCKSEEDTMPEIEPQLIGKWKIRRSSSKAEKQCYVNSIEIQKETMTVIFTTGENGVFREHTFTGEHLYENNTLKLPNVALLQSPRVADNELLFEFEYDADLDYFCAYLNWTNNHTHDNFNGVGSK